MASKAHTTPASAYEAAVADLARVIQAQRQAIAQAAR